MPTQMFLQFYQRLQFLPCSQQEISNWYAEMKIELYVSPQSLNYDEKPAINYIITSTDMNSIQLRKSAFNLSWPQTSPSKSFYQSSWNLWNPRDSDIQKFWQYILHFLRLQITETIIIIQLALRHCVTLFIFPFPFIILMEHTTTHSERLRR